VTWYEWAEVIFLLLLVGAVAWWVFLYDDGPPF
jgi:hypothetical protein